mgnify:CR=1 FL=1
MLFCESTPLGGGRADRPNPHRSRAWRPRVRASVQAGRPDAFEPFTSSWSPSRKALPIGAAQAPGESVKSGRFGRPRGAGQRCAACLEAAERRQLLSCMLRRVIAAAAGQRHQQGRCRVGTAADLRDPGECMGGRAVLRASGAQVQPSPRGLHMRLAASMLLIRSCRCRQMYYSVPRCDSVL